MPRGQATGQTGAKRSPKDREAALELTAKLMRRGYTQFQIVEKLVEAGFPRVSQVTVSNDSIEIRRRWRESMLASVDDMVAEKMAQYEELLRVTWDAYDRSMQDKQKRTQEFIPTPPDEDDEDAEQPKKRKRRSKAVSLTESMQRVKLIEAEEGRLPANEYLRTILMVHEAVRVMKGLDEAQKTENTTTMTIDFNTLAVQASEVRGSRMVEAKIAAVGAGTPVEAKVVEPAKPSTNGTSH